MKGKYFSHSLVGGLTWLAILCLVVLVAASVRPVYAQELDPNPPDEVVRLIFIHHSTGENWLTDGYGDLGRTLDENNYFVSDTNYGWGPDSIGDVTDIYDWPTWFRGEESPRYLEALYQESGQNSQYTRTLSNPGGENEIVMFKSCFPNSNLEGNPDDPPAPGEGLTVSNAKYVYNDLLNYFITRPDKLFIVITAPPVTSSEYADNARAFNNWLVYDWLAENDYPYANVAVFDFYNVLTHPDNHHRFRDGQIEHITSHGDNTSYYPTEDDHPSIAGSQKATEEFVPLLNVFYHRWRAGAPEGPVIVVSEPTSEAEAPGEQPSGEAESFVGGLVDDFESGTPAGMEGWGALWDEATSTTVSCNAQSEVVHQGNMAMQVDFNVATDSWATCANFYEAPHYWQDSAGLSLAMRASQPGLIFDVLLYIGTRDERITYLATVETSQENTEDWVVVELPWEQFERASWEADVSTPPDLNQVIGMAFGLNATGTLWVDDISLMGGEEVEPVQEAEPPVEEEPTPKPEVVSPVQPREEPTPTAEEKPAAKPRFRLCPGSTALIGMAALVVAWRWKRKITLPRR